MFRPDEVYLLENHGWKRLLSLISEYVTIYCRPLFTYLLELEFADETRHYRGFRPMATYLDTVRHASISFRQQPTMENKLSKYDHQLPHGLSVSASRSRPESCVIDASTDKGPVILATDGYWTCSKHQFGVIVGLRFSTSV